MKLLSYFQEIFDPLDFESFLVQHKNIVEHDLLWNIFKYPLDNNSLNILDRRSRVNNGQDHMALMIKDCLRNYTSDWVQIYRRFQVYNVIYVLKRRQNELWKSVQNFTTHIYEIDLENSINCINVESSLSDGLPKIQLHQHASRNSISDPLVLSVLDYNSIHVDNQDRINESLRNQDRPDTFYEFYFHQLGVEFLESRSSAQLPFEHFGHKIMFRCLTLNFNIDIEPIFVSAFLYDLSLKKRISENFYFDLTGENFNKLVSRHVPTKDISTKGSCGIFHVTFPSPDIFLVIKFEKVLQQGEISDVVEPYIKLDDKMREKVRTNAKFWCEQRGQYRMPFAWTALNLSSLLAGNKSCSTSSLERGLSLEKDKNSKSNFSLDKLTGVALSSDGTKSCKMSSPQGAGYYFSSPLIHAGARQRGSLPRDLLNLGSQPVPSQGVDGSAHRCACNFCSTPLSALEQAFKNFRPFTTTLTNLFKQESDKISDEDLYKNLLEIKKNSTSLATMRKFKCIPVTMKLEFLPCPPTVRNCLTAQGSYLEDDLSSPTTCSLGEKTLYPVREILEFPSETVYNPNYSFRNLLYVYPRKVNFTSRAGSSRNVTIKVELLSGEGDGSALRAIFGQSNGPQFLKECYTTVLYHNKMPDIYNEIKIDLPPDVDDKLHLFFTFYHVSCQALKSGSSASSSTNTDSSDSSTIGYQQNSLSETIIGYTWFPLFRDTRIRTGEHSLPICLDHPPPVYSNIDPEVALPGIRWLDNHKNLFDLNIKLSSTLYSEDPYLNQFLHLTRCLDDGLDPDRHLSYGGRIHNYDRFKDGVQKRLKQSLVDLKEIPVPELVPFLYVVFDKLIAYLTRPIVLDDHYVNMAPAVFESIGHVLAKLREHHPTSRNDLGTGHAHHHANQQSPLPPHPSTPQAGLNGSKNGYSHPSGTDASDYCPTTSAPPPGSSTCQVAEEKLRYRPVEMLTSYLRNCPLVLPVFFDDEDPGLPAPQLSSAPNRPNMLYGSSLAPSTDPDSGSKSLINRPFRNGDNRSTTSDRYPGLAGIGNDGPVRGFGALSSASESGNYGTLGRKKSTKGPSASNNIHNRSASDPDLQQDGIDQSDDVSTCLRKRILHEECCLQFVVSSGHVRENALANAWFFFELMCKSMVEYLAQNDKLTTSSRKKLFSESYLDDIASLFNIIVSEIAVRYSKDVKFPKELNTSLAYFTYDMLSIMDIGFVMTLIKSYYKQISSKILTSADPSNLIGLKLDFLEVVSQHEHFLAMNLPFQVFWATSQPDNLEPSHPTAHEGYEGPNVGGGSGDSYDLWPIDGPHPPGSGDQERDGAAESCKEDSSCRSGDATSSAQGIDVLPVEFKRQHFLIGLLLTDLISTLETRYTQFHNRAIHTLTKLLAAHDCDERYDNGNASTHPQAPGDMQWPDTGSNQVLPKGMGKIVKTRIASLYFPLLGIIVGSVTQMCDNFFQIAASNTYKSGAGGSNRNSMTNEYDSYNSPLSSIFFSSSARQSVTEEMFDQLFAAKRTPLSYEATKHLLSCFVWILKNIDKTLLKHWWSELSLIYLAQFLEVLYMVTRFFEYKGKNLMKNHAYSSKTTEVVKSRLEDVILGTLNARSELIARRKGASVVATENGIINVADTRNLLGNSDTVDSRLRWRKDIWRSSVSGDSTSASLGAGCATLTSLANSSGHFNAHPTKILDPGQRLRLEMGLCAETSLVVIDTLELFIQFIISDDLTYKPLVIGVMRILLNLFSCNQSVQVLENLFATQRSIVSKFPDLFFEEETEMCSDICKKLLQHACSSISTVRAQASASLYHLMCRNFEQGNNFALVKMKVTMSLSTLVGTNQTFDEAYLLRSLRTILNFSEQDVHMQGTSFPAQVKKLVSNLNMILSDTVKMKEYQEDHEMLIDLMYRIANGYHNSPDLRLTWLQNMAAKHSQRSNHSEAAQCLIHSSAMVTEYLQLMEDRLYLPKGAVSYMAISENIFEESVISDDNIVALHEEGMFGSKYFSEYGLIGLLEQAASSFNMAGEFEVINSIYKLILPIHEHYNDFKKLASIHGKLHEIFNKIIHQEGKRVNFGTYFRVGFYGAKFLDLDREEYIYKEPAITKLSEINNRLLAFYGEKFGELMVESIKDSNQVDPGALDQDKAYIQITYVEPYFDLAEEMSKTTVFEKNYNIRRFMYATPFTRDGKSHGLLQDQCKRKTILTTQNSFPYLKTRVKVADRAQFVLNPIEVAIEDLQKKTKELKEATYQEPADLKILAMVLQGCLGPTVNQGPLEVANVFLKDVVEGKVIPTIHHNKLRLCFKDFMRRCRDALIRNKGLCHVEQKEYQKQIESNYQQLSTKLSPFMNNKITLSYVKYMSDSN